MGVGHHHGHVRLLYAESTGVLVRVHGYSGLIVSRYPSSVAIISGRSRQPGVLADWSDIEIALGTLSPLQRSE